MSTGDLICELADAPYVTVPEIDAVLDWCREWYADCDWSDADADADRMPVAALLRGADLHIGGGLAFVLADVRRLELAGRPDDGAAELRGTDAISRATAAAAGYPAGGYARTRAARGIRAAFPSGAHASAAILERRLGAGA